MLTIEREVDLVIDLQSTNAALIANKDIRELYQRAIHSGQNWEGVFTVRGEDLVIASAPQSYWWDGHYGAATAITTSDEDSDDEEITISANSFGNLDTWQTVSRFIEEGYFVVKYQADDEKTRIFKVSRGLAELI